MSPIPLHSWPVRFSAVAQLHFVRDLFQLWIITPLVLWWVITEQECGIRPIHFNHNARCSSQECLMSRSPALLPRQCGFNSS